MNNVNNVDVDSLDTIRDIAIVIGFAIVILFTIFKVLQQKAWIKKRGIKAEGKVVALIEKVTKGTYKNKFVDTVTYFPVIEYTSHKWEKITKQHYVDRAPSVYKIGDKVSIIFDEKNPDRFIIER